MAGALAMMMAARAAQPITVSGALGAVGTGSTTVQGTQRIVTVPAGNSGIIVMKNMNQALGNMQIKVHSAAFAGITEAQEFTFTNGQNIQFQGLNLVPEEEITGEAWDKDTNTKIATFGSISIARGAS